MKNLTEIAEVLDRGGVLIHTAHGTMRLRKTDQRGMEVSHGSAPFVRCENFAPLQSLMCSPDNWSEYHEPPPPPPEPTVAELKELARKAHGAFNGAIMLGDAKGNPTRQREANEFFAECDRLGIK